VALTLPTVSYIRSRIAGEGAARNPVPAAVQEIWVLPGWAGRPPGEGQRMFLGLRTVIYPAPDLAASKAWFTRLLGLEPYFDEAFSVGFTVAGYELALDPSGDPAL